MHFVEPTWKLQLLTYQPTKSSIGLFIKAKSIGVTAECFFVILLVMHPTLIFKWKDMKQRSFYSNA